MADFPPDVQHTVQRVLDGAARRLLDATLQVGDEIRKGQRSYFVIGYTSRGKIRLRREQGTELTCWWAKVSDLPKGYWRVDRAR